MQMSFSSCQFLGQLTFVRMLACIGGLCYVTFKNHWPRWDITNWYAPIEVFLMRSLSQNVWSPYSPNRFVSCDWVVMILNEVEVKQLHSKRLMCWVQNPESMSFVVPWKIIGGLTIDRIPVNWTRLMGFANIVLTVRRPLLCEGAGDLF